jgi:hypothetical protein
VLGEELLAALGADVHDRTVGRHGTSERTVPVPLGRVLGRVWIGHRVQVQWN